MSRAYPVDKKLVMVAMSGGVDSSVAAALLKKRGFDVVGIHMRCYNVDGCAEQDAEDARRAAEVLNIPFYVFDFEREYKKIVVNYMIDGYKNGITPNPDVMCNKEIKFGLFFKKAMEMGADYMATGHYVRRQVIKLKVSKVLKVRTKKNSQLYKHYELYKLLTARDKRKDQSYFLWTLTQDQLRHCLFPIGEYKKPQVRKLAAKFGLLNAAKKDSQGICFLGKVSLPDFLKKYIKTKKGDVVLVPLRHSERSEESPKVVGIHNGAHFYTIGQRHIGMANRRPTQTERGITRTESIKPLYVVEKNIKTNTIVVAEGDDHPALYKKDVTLTDVNFLSPVIASPRAAGAKQSDCRDFVFSNRRGNLTAVPVFARVRYRQPFVKAKLCQYPYSRELENRLKQNRKLSDGWRLVFAKPIKFVAPGQSAVFYDFRGVMLGGGIIKSAT